MRESNFTFPPQNRAVVSITHLLYDRRALDTSSHLAILNNLTSLTYLTSTSPRIREILTTDGGLERLLDILRDSLLPREGPTPHDLWGLSGPPTARVISVDRAILCRHSLAFQCVVNIGVRGSESIRTRVVQAGALDLVAQILESWLKHHGVSIFACPLGSQAAVDQASRGIFLPVESRSRPPGHGAQPVPSIVAPPQPSGRAGGRGSFGQFMASLTRRRDGGVVDRLLGPGHGGGGDTDVDMADEEGGGDTDVSGGMDDGSVGADDSMEIDAADLPGPSNSGPDPSGQTTTPRASQSILPMMMAPARMDESMSAGSSAGNSFTSEGLGVGPQQLVRTNSENSVGTTSNLGPRPIPAPLNLAVRIPSLAQDPLSTQSSPTGTPRGEGPGPRLGRRDTIVARPINLALPRREDPTASDASDADVDLQTATIQATIMAAQAQVQTGALTNAPQDRGPEQDAGLVVATQDDEMQTNIGDDVMAEEQARMDMEAGAPPGQPGATQTPLAPAPPTPLLPPVNPQQPAQIIIANGAPRGFNDLGSYVGISSLLNPDGDQYSEDSILLSLQLLAYLSKYPHVRAAFHHPRRPMHPTFDLGTDVEKDPLPQRPAVSETPNVFTLVERFTFRPSPSDPNMFRIPPEIQYWAGVIMRNACRKDEGQGGIRQCANMRCGKWEVEPREFAKCRRCRKAKYCSKECQSKAWAEGHKFWCNAKSDIDAGSVIPPPGDGPGDDDEDAPPRPHHRPTTRTHDPRPPHWRAPTHHNHVAAPPPTAPAPPPQNRQVGFPEIDASAYDPILPANTQLDLLRQTQRRLRTTTDELAHDLAQRGRALGLGPSEASQSPGPGQPTTTPTRRSPTMRVNTSFTHTQAGPGEAFSPLGLPPGTQPGRRQASGISTGRPPQMIPTSARTVSPLQPTFQIPVFGATQGPHQAHGLGHGFGQGR